MNEVKKPPSKFKDFMPLIIIFSVIILATLLVQLYLGEWDTTHAMRDFMGFFFIVFGGFKVINWKGFVAAYSIYDIIAKRSKIYAYLYPVIEIGLGVSYLANFYPLITNWITFVIMIIGAIGVGIELRKKVEIPCACLGVLFKIPMTKVTLFEDLLMAAMALWMIVTML